MGSHRAEVTRRLAVTAIVPCAALLLARVTLPGLDSGVLERFAGGATRGDFDPTLLGIFAFELHPLISASWVVEVLALVAPNWRRWRLGGYPEREHLWVRVKAIAVLLALVQAFFFVRWIQRTSDIYPAFLGTLDPFRDDTLMCVAQMLTLGGGVVLLYWLARLIDRYGAGNGISVLIAAFSVGPVVRPLVVSVRRMIDNGERNLLPLGLAAAGVAALTRLCGGRPLRPGGLWLDSDMLPAPASSVKPLTTAFAALELPRWLAKFGVLVAPGVLTSGSWMRRGLEAAFTAAFCLLYAWAFNQPRVVADAWRRAGVPEVDPEETKARVRAAFTRALVVALGTCWGLLAIEWYAADANLKLSLIGATIIACVVADVVGELGFRSHHGELAAAWPVHRLYVLTPLLRAVEAAGITAFPRARHYRTLWNFFAPFAPVEILVPAGDVRRAEAILRPLAEATRRARSSEPAET